MEDYPSSNQYVCLVDVGKLGADKTDLTVEQYDGHIDIILSNDAEVVPVLSFIFVSPYSVSWSIHLLQEKRIWLSIFFSA